MKHGGFTYIIWVCFSVLAEFFELVEAFHHGGFQAAFVTGDFFERAVIAEIVGEYLAEEGISLRIGMHRETGIYPVAYTPGFYIYGLDQIVKNEGFVRLGALDSPCQAGSPLGKEELQRVNGGKAVEHFRGKLAEFVGVFNVEDGPF